MCRYNIANKYLFYRDKYNIIIYWKTKCSFFDDYLKHNLVACAVPKSTFHITARVCYTECSTRTSAIFFIACKIFKL